MKCQFCSTPITRGRYCAPCYTYLRKHPEGFPSSLPPHGVVVFNEKHEAQCHECGLFFTKLGNHIAFKHHMTQSQYKDAHGIYRTHSLCDEPYKEKMRTHVRKHYRRVVRRNLIKGGKNTRFKKGVPVDGRGKHIKTL